MLLKLNLIQYKMHIYRVITVLVITISVDENALAAPTYSISPYYYEIKLFSHININR